MQSWQKQSRISLCTLRIALWIMDWKAWYHEKIHWGRTVISALIPRSSAVDTHHQNSTSAAILVNLDAFITRPFPNPNPNSGWDFQILSKNTSTPITPGPLESECLLCCQDAVESRTCSGWSDLGLPAGEELWPHLLAPRSMQHGQAPGVSLHNLLRPAPTLAEEGRQVSMETTDVGNLPPLWFHSTLSG